MSRQNRADSECSTGDVVAELPRSGDSSAFRGFSPINNRQNTRRDNSFKYDADNDLIFALDEDVVEDFKNATDTKSISSDDEELKMANKKKNITSFSSTKFTPRNRHPIRHTIRGTNIYHPSTALAVSLPVNITNGMYARSESFPDDDGKDDSEEDNDSENENDQNRSGALERPRAKTIISTREDRMYRNIQAYSRSIQPIDDPERLFGERPHRRYRITEQSGGDDDGNDKNSHLTPATSATVGDKANVDEFFGVDSTTGDRINPASTATVVMNNSDVTFPSVPH